MKKLYPLLLALCLTLPSLAQATDTSDNSAPKCGRHDSSHFKAVDKNGDGFIDKDEARAAHEAHFDSMDSNHDGKLSPDELKHCKCKHGKHQDATSDTAK
jgi:hypothetical protein